MDDLTMLRELGREFDPPAAGPAPATRERVLTATRSTRGDRARRTALRWGTPGLTAALAGALALAFLLPSRPTPAPAGPGVLPRAGSGTPTSAATPTAAALDARHILLAAAATARAEAGPRPPDDAFVYTRSLEQLDGRRSEREAWLSVDGRRDSAVTPTGSTDLVAILGCPASGKVRHRKGSLTSVERCVPDPAYRADAPTDADAAYRRLMKAGSTPGNAFKEATELLRENAVPPAAVPAVLEAMARIPGIQVVGGVRTLSGRPGVAVTMVEDLTAAAARKGFDTATVTAQPSEPGRVRHALIIDAADHRLLGGWDSADTSSVRPAGYVWETLAHGIVAEVRLRPDGTRRGGPLERDGA